jgi:hypothetical protein
MVLFAGILAPMLCHGHYWNVHERITDRACQSSDGLNTFLNENPEAKELFAITPDTDVYSLGSPNYWLQYGSIMEDEQYYGSFPIKQFKETFGLTERSMDHFYTVIPSRATLPRRTTAEWKYCSS